MCHDHAIYVSVIFNSPFQVFNKKKLQLQDIHVCIEYTFQMHSSVHALNCTNMHTEGVMLKSLISIVYHVFFSLIKVRHVFLVFATLYKRECLVIRQKMPLNMNIL